MTSFQSFELTELPVVENSQLFAQRAHSARYAPFESGCLVWTWGTAVWTVLRSPSAARMQWMQPCHCINIETLGMAALDVLG